MAQLGEVSQFEFTAGVLRHYIAGEVCLDLTRTESIDGILIQLADLAHQLGAFLDQLALRLVGELAVELAVKLLKLHHFLVLDALDAVKSGELVLCLRCELMLDVFHEGIQLLDPILLRFLDLLNASLHFADVVLQVSKPTAQPTCLASDQVHVPLVDLFELLELMALVGVAKESAVRADRHLAGLAEVAQRRVVLGAELFLAI